MKKLILTLSVAALAVTISPLTAQEAKPEGGKGAKSGAEGGGRGGARMNPEQRLKRMTELLSLSQEQQDKVKAIMEEDRAKFEEVRNAPEGERREKFAALMKGQAEKIGEVLTPEQKTKWQAEMEKRRSEGGGRPEGRRGEGGAKPEEKK